MKSIVILNRVWEGRDKCKASVAAIVDGELVYTDWVYTHNYYSSHTRQALEAKLQALENLAIQELRNEGGFKKWFENWLAERGAKQSDFGHELISHFNSYLKETGVKIFMNTVNVRNQRDLFEGKE